MNPITYAIERIIENDIPKPMLLLAFNSRLAHNQINHLTLEAQIRKMVIEPRVLKDCNLQHGTMIHIPVKDCKLLEWDYYTSTYLVPKNLTQGKRITSVLHVTNTNGAIMPTTMGGASAAPGIGNGMYSATMSGTSNVGALMSAHMQMAASVSPVQIVSNALTYLVGENTIMVKDITVMPNTMFFRVMIENDENFNHIQPQWYTTFHELVLEAIKMYMYNNLVLEQDNVFIHSGGELNRFKEILDEYRESRDLYKELLMAWTKSALFNDPEASRREYQFAVSGGQ